STGANHAGRGAVHPRFQTPHHVASGLMGWAWRAVRPSAHGSRCGRWSAVLPCFEHSWVSARCSVERPGGIPAPWRHRDGGMRAPGMALRLTRAQAVHRPPLQREEATPRVWLEGERTVRHCSLLLLLVLTLLTSPTQAQEGAP